MLSADFYRRLVIGGSIGAAELYIDMSWETDDLTSVIRVFARNLPALDKLETRLAWLTYPFNKYQHCQTETISRKQRKHFGSL